MIFYFTETLKTELIAIDILFITYQNLSRYLSNILNYFAILGSLVLPRCSEWLAFNFRDQDLVVTSSYSSSCSAWDRQVALWSFLRTWSLKMIFRGSFNFLSSYLTVVTRLVAAIT